MLKKQNIFLIGLMGSGKTSIGQALAGKLKFSFYDTDHEIERNMQMSISKIFAAEGEKKFREYETSVIERLAQLQHIVLATGGGSVLSPQNRQTLSACGIVIYLKPGIDRLVNRTQYGMNRPLLTGQDHYAVLAKLQQEREPLYREIADLVYETDQQNINATVCTIMKDIEKYTF